MKRIVLIVVGALLAIAMIPIIVVSINRITQGTIGEETVTFTINVTDGTYSPNVFNEIVEFGLVNESGYFTNVIEVKLNDVITNDLNIGYSDPAFIIYSISLDGSDNFSNNGIYNPGDGIFNDNDVISITFDEVPIPAQVTGVGAALLNLVPILFVLGTVFSLVIFTKELE